MTDALHIFVLCGFAIAQPLLDLMGRTAEFFVVRRSQPTDVVLLVLLVCLLLPALLVLVEAAAGRVGPRVRQAVHGMIVAVLVAAIALPALKRLDGIPGAYLVAGATLLGVALTVGYLRLASLRFYLTVLSPAVLIFPGLFLFFSPVSKVVFPPPQPEAAYPKVKATAPIVMVIFDELPVTSLMDQRRRIDPVRYPNFAALAQDATWFRNATTVADFTTQALPAMLTGKYPTRNLHPTAADHPRSIFALLAGSYDLKVSEAVTQLCPEELCEEEKESGTKRMQSLVSDLSIVYLHILLPKEFSLGLPSITETWRDFTGDATKAGNNQKRSPKLQRRVKHREGGWRNDRREHFMDFVSTIHSAEKPTLYWLHSVTPHVPYQYLPSGKTYYRMGRRPYGLGKQNKQNKWHDDEWAVLQGYQAHLLQVGFVDTLIGRLLARLKEAELYDRSLIVVTADHGVSFRSGDHRRRLTQTNYQDILPVPLFIKAPYQQEGGVNDRNVESIDILPTMADILGMDIPWPIDGQSALDPSVVERQQKVIYSATRKKLLTFPATILDAQNVAWERKLTLLGSGAISEKLFKIGPYGDLVGRRVADVAVGGDAEVKLGLYQPELFARVQPNSAFVPAHIMGYVRSGWDTEAPLNLAVAINGTIRATTRTYTFPLAGKRKVWSAVVEESSFHAGQNEVEVFVINSSRGKPVLARAYTPAAPRQGRNVAMAAAKWTWGVEQTGLHVQELSKKDTPIRWTDGAARLLVPLDENRPPQALRVDLASTGHKGTELTVLVNGDVLFHESVPAGRWSKTFSLAGRSFNQHLTLELLSDTFIPRETYKGSNDRRTLGVLVKAVTLLESDSVDSLAEGAPGN